jgi:DNA-binding MarR family transcriptional regulator
MAFLICIYKFNKIFFQLDPPCQNLSRGVTGSIASAKGGTGRSPLESVATVDILFYYVVDFIMELATLGLLVSKFAKKHSLILRKVLKSEKKYRLSITSLEVLEDLKDGEPKMMTDISSGLLMHVSNLTPVIDRLVKNALVTREIVEEDRRIVHIQLTESGAMLLDRLDNKIHKELKELFRGIQSSDANKLELILRKII